MELETFALLISVIGNFISVFFAAYSKAHTTIVLAKSRTNKEIQILKQCITIFMNSKNFEQAKILCQKTLLQFENNHKKEESHEHK